MHGLERHCNILFASAQEAANGDDERYYLARFVDQVWWALAHGPRWMHSTPGPLAFETDEPGERSLGSHAPIASMEACQARRKEPFFWNSQVVGDV